MKRYFLLLLFSLFSTILICQIEYHDVAQQIGINHDFGYGAPGGGISFVDFDGNGWDDLTLATENGKEIYFYRNFDGIFQKIPPLVDHYEESKQVLWVDFDNDDDLDFYVTTYGGTNRLYQNNGNLELEDITESAGLPIDSLWHYGASWGDFDRDGWLDIYFSERKTFEIGTTNRSRLFRNNADGTFTEVTQDAQAEDADKLPFCSAFFDYNNDRWPDLYTAHDKFHTNTLLRNNKNGTFTDMSVPSQSNIAINAMCVAVGDYNNDSYQDIYVTNLPLGNALLKNIKLGVNHFFTEVAASSGVGFYATSWGSSWLDGDNDGWQDLYVSGADVGTDAISAAFYKNETDGTFSQDVIGFEGDTVNSFSNAVGDYNNDGYPDIMVSNFNPFNSQLWKNEGGTNNWLKINLRGVVSNRDGVGAKIEIYSDGNFQMRYTHCGIGYLAQNSKDEIVGLGSYSQADSIIVTWPTGHIDKLFDVTANQLISIEEGSTTNGDIQVDEDVTITIPPPPNAVSGLEKVPTVMNVYPNPVEQNLFVLITNKEGEGNLMVKNLLGENILEVALGKFENEIELNLEGIDAGVYFLTYQSNGNLISQKIIVH